VTLERLYTPWRLAYVTGAAKSSACVFCAALADEDADPLIVFRGSTCFVILNLFPYNNGHLMVVPNRHIATLVDARPDELEDMMATTRLSEMALRETFNPEGINRRHQLHDGHRADPSAAAGAAGDGGSAAAGLRPASPRRGRRERISKWSNGVNEVNGKLKSFPFLSVGSVAPF
jgi:hypothetical protein